MTIGPTIALLLAVLPATNSSFVSAKDAVSQAKDGALLIDARGQSAKPPFAKDAIVVDWLELRERGGRSGLLMMDEADLMRQLAALGIDATRPIIVYGDGTDGAEARVWWMLHYVGLTNVRILDGGIVAWTKAKGRTAKTPVEAKRAAPVPAKVVKGLRVDMRAVNQARKAKSHVIIDARSKEEFDGATPALSPRGGHVPGAVNVDWKSLVDERGRLLPPAKIEALLKAAGIDPALPKIVYCTAGTRAAFVVAALVGAGDENVALYDGSWFEWSAESRMPVSP